MFATRTLVLMPFAMALNIVLGSVVGQFLRLPIYLDSIGTVLVGALAGPLPGLVTGVLSDLLWGYAIPPPVGSPTVGPFSITAGFIGLLAVIWLFNGTLYAIGWLTRKSVDAGKATDPAVPVAGAPGPDASRAARSGRFAAVRRSAASRRHRAMAA